jgi:hypothetical protein
MARAIVLTSEHLKFVIIAVCCSDSFQLSYRDNFRGKCHGEKEKKTSGKNTSELTILGREFI